MAFYAKNVRSLLLASLLAVTNTWGALTQDQQQILTTHNQFRKLHQAPPLHWDAELAQYAAAYAAQCRFKHSGGKYGENLAAGYRSSKEAIQAWHDESKSYSYQRPGFSKDTGHFTQLVWKSTTKLGCALVTCDGLNDTPGEFLVCEYNPPGNVVSPGYFENNVIAEN